MRIIDRSRYLALFSSINVSLFSWNTKKNRIGAKLKKISSSEYRDKRIEISYETTETFRTKRREDEIFTRVFRIFHPYSSLASFVRIREPAYILVRV